MSLSTKSDELDKSTQHHSDLQTRLTSLHHTLDDLKAKLDKAVNECQEHRLRANELSHGLELKKKENVCIREQWEREVAEARVKAKREREEG